MIILSFDTTAHSGSVSLIEDGKIIGEFFINTKLTHSQTLMTMCNALFENTYRNIDEVDFFAVNAGPGSFTGVRIGVSAIKAMAWAKNKPCVSVSTLESIAYNMKSSGAIVCALMDARCNQFYNALFKCEENGNIIRLCEDRASSFEEIATSLIGYHDERIILCGDGADLAYKLMSGLVENLEVAQQQLRYQKASGVGLVAIEKAIKGETLTAKQLMPTYLRLSQAERELKKKKQ